MIRAGRLRGGEVEIDWAVGDAQALPLADVSADAYSIGFGLRNVTDIPAALAEARRVLKPGGRFLCLEFSKLSAAALRPLYDAYSFQLIPRIGSRIAGDAEAYQYLVESIRRFPDQKTLATLMAGAGFGRVSFTNFTGGVVALHQGWVI
jgi:demethylmenaquinone methyltransferase / 2-methoxy-6-polyprenyl-1,4-benzoquinol methylase